MTRSTLTIAAVGVVALAGAALLSLVDPASSRLFPRCLFLQATGLFCPGCGVQRAMHALLNGRVVEALSYNSLAVASLPVVLLGASARLAPARVGQAISRVPAAAYWAVLAAVVTFWVLRNVPAWPFAALAP